MEADNLLVRLNRFNITNDFVTMCGSATDVLNIVVFSDIRAVTMAVCWHYLLFQFSNFEFPNLAI
jgi:hypothetical protein